MTNTELNARKLIAEIYDAEKLPGNAIELVILRIDIACKFLLEAYTQGYHDATNQKGGST